MFLLDMNSTTPAPADRRHMFVTAGIYVIYVGSATSVLALLVALGTYCSNKFLRIKRQNIITANICFSFIVFYTGFLASLISIHKEESEEHGVSAEEEKEHIVHETTSACIAGASIHFAGWISVLFWILVNWLYVSWAIKQRVPRHIDHFFIKSAIPTYGMTMILVIALAVTDAKRNYGFVSDLCFYDLSKWEVAGITIAFTSIVVLVIVSCAVFCCFQLSRTVKTTFAGLEKKNRRTLVRLALLTVIVVITEVPHFILWFATGDGMHVKNSENFYHIEIVNGVVSGLTGSLVAMVIMFRSQEFRIYWSAVFKGENPTKIRNFRFPSTHKVPNTKAENYISSITADDVPPPLTEPSMKFRPRDQGVMKLTHDDEVFFATSSRRDDRSSNPAVANKILRKKSNSLRNKVMRSSVTSSTKKSTSAKQSTSSTGKKSPISHSLTLNRYDFQSSRGSLGGELERKSSF